MRMPQELRNCLGSPGRLFLSPRWKIRIEESEHMCVVNNAHAFLLLQLGNLPLELLHFRPVHFGPEMMFRMIPVVEEEPVVNLPIAAYSPRNRLVGIGTVMAKVAVQITEAVSEVKKRQKEEKNIAPVEEEHDQ